MIRSSVGERKKTQERCVGKGWCGVDCVLNQITFFTFFRVDLCMIRGIEKQNKKMTRRADGRKEQKGNQKITKSQMETGKMRESRTI